MSSSDKQEEKHGLKTNLYGYNFSFHEDHAIFDLFVYCSKCTML